MWMYVFAKVNFCKATGDKTDKYIYSLVAKQKINLQIWNYPFMSVKSIYMWMTAVAHGSCKACSGRLRCVKAEKSTTQCVLSWASACLCCVCFLLLYSSSLMTLWHINSSRCVLAVGQHRWYTSHWPADLLSHGAKRISQEQNCADHGLWLTCFFPFLNWFTYFCFKIWIPKWVWSCGLTAVYLLCDQSWFCGEIDLTTARSA